MNRSLSYELPFKSVSRNRSVASLSMFFMIGSGLAEGLSFGMIVPLLQSLGDEGEPNRLTSLVQTGLDILGLPFTLQMLLGIFAGLVILKFAFQAAQLYSTRLLSSSVTRQLRNEAFEAVMTAPLSFSRQRKAGDDMATIFTSTMSAGSSIESFFVVLSACGFCAAYLILNMVISVELTLMAIGLILISALLIRPRLKRGYRFGMEQKVATDDMTSFLLDYLSGIKTIKAFALERTLSEKYRGITKHFQGTALNIQKNRIVADLFMEPFVTLASIAIAVYAVTILEMPLILLVTFFLIIVRMIPQLKLISTNWLQFINQLPHFERIEETVAAARVSKIKEGDLPVSSLTDRVKLDGVTYFHHGANVASVEDVVLDIPRNKVLALVGESGAGKTTLVDLIIGHHHPTAGRILIDDVDLADIKRSSWSALVAVVDQEAHLFNASIAENIRFGKLGASDGDIRAAARMAHADTFIRDMPESYETIVGDRGARLSGGQRQRIALARALVRNPEILVLDEATSALDSESERLVQEAIKEVSASKTVIVIAHRLSTVTRADKIVVMDKGRIVAEGTHAELSESNDIYKNYVRLQFTDATATE